MPEMKIESVLNQYKVHIMSISGVVGIGQGLCDGRSCITIYVAKMTPELADKIPEKLEGYPVVIKETGVIGAFPENRR